MLLTRDRSPFPQNLADGVRQIPDRFGIPVSQHIDDFRESGHCEAADERHHLARLRDDLHIVRLADCDEHQRMNPPRVAAEDRTVNNLPRVAFRRVGWFQAEPHRHTDGEEPEIDHARERALVYDRVGASLTIPCERLMEFYRHVDVDCLKGIEVAVRHHRLL